MKPDFEARFYEFLDQQGYASEANNYEHLQTYAQFFAAGDACFFGGSHRVLQNSDVTVLFLDVIPRLKRGIVIHRHDIFWTMDYPDAWAKRMYSEQYLIGSLLLYSPQLFEIILPNAYISWRTNLGEIFKTIWEAPHLAAIERHGISFWFSIV